MKRTQEKRERMIGVKVTEDEYEHIRVLAFEAKKSLGAFIRDVVLSKKAKGRR